MGEMRKISDFFNFISQQLLWIQEHAPWADDQRVVGKLEQLDIDVVFLFMFFRSFEKLEDEQSRFRLRCTITAFRVLWDWEAKRNGLVQKSLMDSCPVDVQAFLSMAFELEGKIQPSKLLLQQFCEYMLRSSSRQLTQVYSHGYILSILDNFYRDRAAKIFPFKNQIDILKDKVPFMRTLSVELNYHAFSEKIDRIKKYTRDFIKIKKYIRDFIKNAVCIEFLFWAKGADEEVATVLLYDMSNKFMPYALDFSFLFSQRLLNSDVLLEFVAGFVEFFFKHLDHDFFVLGDPLTLVFISLSNTPHQSIEAEEEVLRTQMFSLFHDHLLSFCHMNQLLYSNNKTFLLTHFEIANAKIRQLYYARFSDSCITLDAEKLDYIYFVSISKQLYLIDKYSEWTDSEKSQLCVYRMELRFLRVFFLCFATWDNKDINERLSSMITNLQGIWQKGEEKMGLLVTRLHAIRQGVVADWHPFVIEIEEKIQLSRLEMKTSCVNLFDLSFQFKPKTSHKMVQFMDSMLNILNELVTFKANEIVPFKKQIENLEEKLVFLRNFMKLTVNCIDSKELTEFKMFVQSFANDAACLIFFYWAKDAKENIPSEVNHMLSHMLQQINPVMPDNAKLYFQTLKIIYLQRSDSLLFGQTTSIFIQNLLTPFKDDFQILHDELIFLLTFLNDPPNKNAGEVICSHIDDPFWEDVYYFLPFDDTEGVFVEKKTFLNDFIIKIRAINKKIRKHYFQFLDSSLYNFPKVVSPLLLDFIIQNLKSLNEKMVSDRKFVTFAKYKIIKIREELVSLRPFFNYIFDLQSEQNEAWLEVVNIVHLTQHIINSCISSLFVFDNPIWYHMAYLSEVIDRIKVVKTKLEKIKQNTMYNARRLPRSTSCTPLKQARPLEITESVVGFENEAEIIIGMLTQLNMSLDIVSIVGMGGLGKTTLAKLVYGSATAKGNFDVFAFCSVSQDHNARRLLMDILRNITGDDESFSNMTKDNLAHKLWQTLSYRTYLIVLDDIWDISPWNEVKSSFPDNKNGSRVMFTTRFQDVADKCKINCSPYQLRFMSEDESWELLQRKVFPDGISPQNFLDIGRTIAKNCKGLPLAVVVIAGLLVRTEKSLRWWNEVAEKVTSYLYDEGCMKILELSYNHLPEILKPCFLYLAAFPEDWVIKVKKVTLLWISEGFIQESKIKSLDDVARDFIQDLADRSLIIVGARSSDGGIKEFRIHDLIRDLCQTKCLDENFMLLNHETASSSYSDPLVKNHYRVSTQKESDVTVGSSILNTSSLLYFPKEYDSITFPFKEFKLAQVLCLDCICDDYDTKQLSSLVHLRHLDVRWKWNPILEMDISSWMFNFWNIGSLIMWANRTIHMPETFWRMKSLRHVEVHNLILKFSEEQEHEEHEEHEAYPKLEKVVSFSCPYLSSGKDVQRLLQRLPAVRKLSCCLFNSDEDSVETLDFPRNIESLNLTGSFFNYCFPSTVRKLTLQSIELPFTAITALTELQFLQVLKLRDNSFPDQRLEMEDMTFQNLKFFELIDDELVEWNAITESLPCLEQLVIGCPKLKELPPCFLESSTLKKIIIRRSYLDDKSIESSALRIQEELMEYGNKVEVSIQKKAKA